MLSKIEIILNDSGQFVVVAGADIVCTYSIKEALQYANYFAKFLAFFPTGKMDCPYANPVPFEVFYNKMKKDAKKKQSTTPTGGEGFKTCT